MRVTGEIVLSIQPFGAFHSWITPDTPLEIRLPHGARLHDARHMLCAALKERGFDQDALVARAVFADDQAILPDDTPLAQNMTLAVLPPVCGG